MIKKTALVTGGAGFIGAHLCRRLISEGMRVVCVDSLVTARINNLNDLKNEPGFIFLREDINSPFNISGRIDYFFHLACPASPDDYRRMPVFTLNTGSSGTRNCLELSKNKKSRFLLASTSEVYGDPEVHPQHEGYHGNVDPIGPRSCYDEAKRFSEALTAAYSRSMGLNSCIARIFNVYGEGMRPSDGRVIPNIICQALAAKPLTVYGNGKQTRSFCYISDMVEGLLRLALSDLDLPVNLGNPEEISILRLSKKVNSLTGNTKGLIFMKPPHEEPRRRKPDIARATRLLGWSPQVSLTEGLKKTIGWFDSLSHNRENKLNC